MIYMNKRTIIYIFFTSFVNVDYKESIEKCSPQSYFFLHYINNIELNNNFFAQKNQYEFYSCKLNKIKVCNFLYILNLIQKSFIPIRKIID